MPQYIIKIVLTTILIVAVSEIAKRSSFLAALLASIPLVSVLAIFWLYFDTKDISKISEFTTSVFWLVLPSLVFFISFPLLLKQGLHFYPSIGLSIGLTVFSYWMLLAALNNIGVKL